MDQKTRLALEAVRRTVIALLNTVDDALGNERTVPSKEDRALLRRLRGSKALTPVLE